MLILAALIALLVDALAVAALVATMRRTASPWIRIPAVAGTVSTVFATTLLASLATVGMQTRIVMYGMTRQEPLTTILETDRDMRGRIRAAVTSGLSREGSKVENVRASVSEVVRPYMAYRLRTAPDRFTVASARATAAMLAKARGEGTETCAAVLAGDAAATMRLADPASAAWLPDMLRAEPLDDVPMAGEAEAAALVAGVAAGRGWKAEDVAAASARRGPLACEIPIAVIAAAADLPEPRAAAMLRRLGFGGQAVATR